MNKLAETNQEGTGLKGEALRVVQWADIPSGKMISLNLQSSKYRVFESFEDNAAQIAKVAAGPCLPSAKSRMLAPK